MIKLLSPKKTLKLIQFWPPFLASGISVESCDDSFNEITVKLVQRRSNSNYVGTHFGGSLYAMCDPFFMFILLQHMREEHIVWDKAASIEFLKPGKGTVRAKFRVNNEQIEQLKSQALENFSLSPVFEAEVIDSDGEVIARVKKTLYIRRKDAKERFRKQKAAS